MILCQSWRSIYEKGTTETKRFALKIISKYGGWDIAGDFLKELMKKTKKNKPDLCFCIPQREWYNYSIRLGTEQKKCP